MTFPQFLGACAVLLAVLAAGALIALRRAIRAEPYAPPAEGMEREVVVLDPGQVMGENRKP